MLKLFRKVDFFDWLKTMKSTFLCFLALSSSLVSHASAASCPDLESLRSDFVVNKFSHEKLSGFFYEQAYHDIAQAGSSCQTLNVTSDGSNIVADFSVKYGPVPFTIKEM